MPSMTIDPDRTTMTTDRNRSGTPTSRRTAGLCRIVLGGLVLAAAAAAAAETTGMPDIADPRSGTGRAVDIRRDLRTVPQVSFEGHETPSFPTPPASTRRGETEVRTGTGGLVDPLVGDQQRATNKATTSLDVDVNTAGLGFTGATPADVSSDVGGDHVVQMVNAPGGSVFAVFERSSGAMVAGPSRLASLWPPGGACAEGWGHAGVVFDASAGRWLLHEIGAGDHLCVYVSQSVDPVSGGWYGYDFELPRFPDFPRIGVWSDSYIATTSEDLPAVYALERSAMLAGDPAGWLRFAAPALDGFGLQALTPVDLDGPNPPPAGTGGLLIRQVDGALHGGSDRLELFELSVDWSSPQNASLSDATPLAVAAFDSTLCGTAGRSCVPQPGTTIALDPVREVVASLAHYRRYPSHQSLVGTFVVDTDGADHAGLRWFELRRTNASWTVHQEGTYSPDGLHRWIGGLAADRDGNLLLAFNSSDTASIFPSIRVTGRQSDDPTGVMTAAELELRAGTSAQTVGRSPHQWGWSTSVSVDPEDDCTFWTAAAFAEDGAWNTRLVSVRFPTCDSPGGVPIFADGFESGTTGSWGASSP
ncbi:MAG: hypothetical protein PVG53_06720 [Holophagae bacterium]